MIFPLLQESIVFKSIVAVGIVIAGLWAASVLAAERHAPNGTFSSVNPAMPHALAMAVKEGHLKLVATFNATAGLTGYVVSSESGRNDVVYGFPGNDVMFAGHLIDGAGADLNHKYVGQYAPKIDYSKFESRIVVAPAVVEGATGAEVKSTIYIFMDPNCIFCHLTWKALQPYEKIGLQVHWIPMAFLKPSSLNKAAALLDSKDRPSLMAVLEKKFDTKLESGGIDGEVTVSPATKAQLDGNMALFQQLGFNGTPTILYRDKSGKLSVSEGMARLSQLSEITGLPAQANRDPDLASF